MKKVAIIRKTNLSNLDAFENLCDALSKCEAFDVVLCGCFEDVPSDADAVLTFGGDGMVLSIARHLAERDISPAILGVNLGNMGFLTAFESDATAEEIISALKSDRVMHRPLLEAFAPCHVAYALNDVAIRAEGSHPVRLELYVDGEQAACFHGDGVIISTAAGSTAYSLSAGGPVLSPSLSAFCITPICAHTLSARPIVVGDSSLVEVRPVGVFGAHVYMDGDRRLLLAPNRDFVKIAKAKKSARFVDVKTDFFKKLSAKLGGQA